MKRTALLLCLLLAALMLALVGCQWENLDKQGNDEDQTEQTPPFHLTTAGYTLSEDYGQIYARLDEIRQSSMLRGEGVDMTTDQTEEAAAEPEQPMVEQAASDSAANTGAGGSDYSETNVQVEGIDEGDIVKTDGKNIYILRDNFVIIMSAAGSESIELSSFSVGEDSEHGSKWASELYVYGDTLAVILNCYEWGEETKDDQPDYYRYWSNDSTELQLYSIADPTKPNLHDSFRQDGSYISSRLSNGVIYMVSSYYVYDEPEEGAPETYVPCVYDNEVSRLIAPGDICICPGSGTAYTVLSSVDTTTAQRVDEQAALGAGQIVYMRDDNLYVAQNQYQEDVLNSYTEDIYQVEQYQSGNYTEILRYAVEAGQIEFSAGAKVEGGMINQFAMDEYQGYLRVATTINNSSYTVYTDKERGFVNYQWDEGIPSTSAIYILDDSLNVVGELGGMAEDEQIYSVRFDGDIGYIVTFRQVDPLFTVDLSDPTAPQILSALKIPGFSQYLHVYSDGRLFGLGMNADEKTGWSEEMKLSMFDVSDKTNVTEKHTLALDDYWSTALYNHKAILISPQRDVIGFPVDNGYAVYGYSDAEGFYPRGEISLGDEIWYYDCRGLYVGEYFYIYAYDGVYVLDLTTLQELAFIQLAFG